LTGTYRRTLTLNSERFALIDVRTDSTWFRGAPVLEHVKGQNVAAVVGGEGDFLVDRDQARSGPVKPT
jgi:hypothetical protein